MGCVVLANLEAKSGRICDSTLRWHWCNRHYLNTFYDRKNDIDRILNGCVDLWRNSDDSYTCRWDFALTGQVNCRTDLARGNIWWVSWWQPWSSNVPLLNTGIGWFPHRRVMGWHISEPVYYLLPQWQVAITGLRRLVVKWDLCFPREHDYTFTVLLQ